ncbi:MULTISPECIES: ead/Ea22-like family protein [Klebsiella pneumoniae complex]|uniref:ead/Ea22-like family protein n=1 Tax=Klebsiella pneumoniae complex TaxID=3390273 RepID=UPI000DE5CA8F|nr:MULTISPECIES: ead/Ea22-like family protein [Klebsiella]MCL0593279.1 ead/Ea22-like family protein [Klebsiella pneumoniae]WAI45711.1 ead/Ea22-like family protein [Klebsiella quasipneumoniae]SSG52373.1 phage EaA protein [Klebsiella pneumoniae]HBS8409084.1 ead/Ea22-like family protein [Klebsiella pneumoniae]HBS9249699.1 ead/Ea22-like family protein [Klebsiella pneumoniae]
MTDITELAQSLKAAAENAIGAHERLAAYPYGEIIDISQHEGEQIDIDITDLNEFNKEANPVNILALVEALEKAQRRNAELEAQNEYIRKRYQQLDLLIGKNILVMQAAIIEWQATGDAKNGLAWIYNTLFGPGELPDEAEKDAQAYFDRKYAPLDEELMALHKWFWEQSEAERAAAGIKVEAE